MSETGKKISIVIPAYNEEENIKETVGIIASAFRNAEVIVICNGCTDLTSELARDVNRANVRVFDFHNRIGKGGAILEGFKRANGKVVGFVDADGSFSPAAIRKIINAAIEDDSAIASKWKGKKFFAVQSVFMRKFWSRWWNFLARHIAGLDFEDTQAGLKFFNRPVIDALLEEDFICKGFDFDVELLYKIQRRGFKTKEIYVPIKDGGKSSFSMQSSPKMFVNLLRFYFSKGR